MMPKPSAASPLFLVFPLVFCAVSLARAELTNAQGEMTGEVTAETAVVQTRLTDGSKLVDGDLPGHAGVARFVCSTSEKLDGLLIMTEWREATPENDHIVRESLTGLKPGTRYYYRAEFGENPDKTKKGKVCTFKTLDPGSTGPVSFVVVTGMNYAFFANHPSNPDKSYQGPDKAKGFPGLEAILKQDPDFFIGTGDNVYYDHPAKPAARTLPELRKKWHEQFIQPRFIDLFAKAPTYWEKDDHDHRKNDCDTTGDYEPSNELGIATFIEQVPIADPDKPAPLTYRTHRLNKLVQIWLVEGRDFRSPNAMPDGPDKTLWGAEQLEWLKSTLTESDADFKILISPTPLVGPDDASKRDNHTNPRGFRHEGDAFKQWLADSGLLEKNFYVACGDRHWQYHAIDPTGVEEFSCGALVDANSRAGRLAGDPKSTDPEGKIQQPYIHAKPSQATGGFLKITISQPDSGAPAAADFSFFDEHGQLLYRKIHVAK